MTFEDHQHIETQNTTTLFLHTRGYYEYIRDYNGKPNVSELKKFRLPGTFSHFAKKRFLQIAGL